MKLKVTLTKTYSFEFPIKGHKWGVKADFDNRIDEILNSAQVMFIEEMKKIIENKDPLIMGHIIEDDNSTDESFKSTTRHES
jgi:hypothetical protein